MNKKSNFMKFLIVLITIILVFIFLKFGNTSLTYIKSSDESFHLVRNYEDKDEAAEILSEIKNRLEQLINYCIINYPTNKNVLFRLTLEECNIPFNILGNKGNPVDDYIPSVICQFREFIGFIDIPKNRFHT